LEAVSAAGCYDFFAKCPHRLACARCPFYLPKNTTKGELLEVKTGIEQTLEQLDFTDDETPSTRRRPGAHYRAAPASSIRA
jgi:hypothetical protein